MRRSIAVEAFKRLVLGRGQSRERVCARERRRTPATGRSGKGGLGKLFARTAIDRPRRHQIAISPNSLHFDGSITCESTIVEPKRA